MGFRDWFRSFVPQDGAPAEPETSESVTRAIAALAQERQALEERRDDLAQERVRALLEPEADLDRVEAEQLQVARDLERVEAVRPELERRLEEARVREAQVLEDARLQEVAELEERGRDLLAEYGRHGSRIVAILRELRDADQRHRELGARGHLPSRQGRQHQRDVLDEVVIVAASEETAYEVWGVSPGWRRDPNAWLEEKPSPPQSRSVEKYIGGVRAQARANEPDEVGADGTQVFSPFKLRRQVSRGATAKKAG